MTHPNLRGMQLDLLSGAVHPLVNQTLDYQDLGLPRPWIIKTWDYQDLGLSRPGLTELDPQNTTPPTALMYRQAVHRPTHAFLPTVTMFWPHSCRLSRENWRTGAGSHGAKFLLAAALHHAAVWGTGAPLIIRSKAQ
jgi:hypothetical protein